MRGDTLKALGQAIRPMGRGHRTASSEANVQFLEGGVVVSYRKPEKREMPPIQVPLDMGAESLGYVLGFAMMQSVVDSRKEDWKDEGEEDERIEKLVDRMQRLQRRIIEKTQSVETPQEQWVLSMKSVVCKTSDETIAALDKAKVASAEIKGLVEKGEYLCPDIGVGQAEAFMA